MRIIKKNNNFRNIFSNKEVAHIRYDPETYWRDRPNNILCKRYEIMADLIERGTSVLDLGCGDGSFLFYLKQRKKIKELGIDISKNAIERAKAQELNVEFADIDSMGFNIERTYDYIVISEVLEHLINSEDLLKKVYPRFIRYLFITIPNSGYFLYRMSLLLGTFPVQWLFHPAEHLRFWTERDFKFLLKNMQYEIKRIYSCKGIRGIGNLLPELFSQQTLFVLERGKHG